MKQLQQSHHCGIETLGVKHGRNVLQQGSNRTIVGLKQQHLVHIYDIAFSSNRTIVGLKRLNAKARRTCITSSNRTIVGLKQGATQS